MNARHSRSSGWTRTLCGGINDVPQDELPHIRNPLQSVAWSTAGYRKFESWNFSRFAAVSRWSGRAAPDRREALSGTSRIPWQARSTRCGPAHPTDMAEIIVRRTSRDGGALDHAPERPASLASASDSVWLPCCLLNISDRGCVRGCTKPPRPSNCRGRIVARHTHRDARLRKSSRSENRPRYSSTRGRDPRRAARRRQSSDSGTDTSADAE